MLDHLNAALGDRYTVERELGRGGMASVWLARDHRLDRLVAIKVLHLELASAIGVDRFLREIRLTARLQHPNIVPVLDSGVVSSLDATPLPWYAMAYVPGESLRVRLQREGQLSVDEAVRITREPRRPSAPRKAPASCIATSSRRTCCCRATGSTWRILLEQAESLAVKYDPAPLHTAVWLALAHVGPGDADGAMEWLRRFRPAADPHFQLHLRCDPPFAPIENDPRFRTLLVMERPAGSRGC
jgi:hypothetical protein